MTYIQTEQAERRKKYNFSQFSGLICKTDERESG